MPSLFDPLTIKRMELRNRFVRSATVENLGDQGMVTDSLIDLYKELSKGEVGLIITGGLFPKKAGQILPGQLAADRDEAIPGLKRLARVVHENGGKVAAQILHAGGYCSPELTGFPSEGPVSMVNPYTGLQVRALSRDEVHELVELYVLAACRAMEAGFDAVQVHAAHSHLVSLFLSPVINNREDEWGGSVENRSRFVREICQGIRRLAGPDYPILVKIGLLDTHPDGKPLSEGLETAKSLEADGVDCIEVSEGYEAEGAHHIRLDAMSPYYLEECREARPGLSLPLILVGGMRTLKDMKAVLEEGVADAVAMCRPFIMNPHIVQEFREGSAIESECTSCNQCVHEMSQGEPLCCVFN